MNSEPQAQWDSQLMRLRLAHERGDRDAIRTALKLCAVVGFPMPRWLAQLVVEALERSDRGKPDALLGMGSERERVRLRKRYLKGRDASIGHDYAFLRELGVAGVKEHLAKLHRLSPKTIEAAKLKAPISRKKNR